MPESTCQNTKNTYEVHEAEQSEILGKRKKRLQSKTVYPATSFLAAAAAGFGHLGDLRYHEVERMKIEQ